MTNHLPNLVSVEEFIEWLASFGKTENSGVTRLLYTDVWKKAQLALNNKMKQLGFSTSFDCVGNLFGRIQGSDIKGKTILTGSHIDTVIDGGKYDGAYGILASLLAVHKLYQLYGVPKKSLEVVSLCEEEGSRFPITFWGSRNIRGAYSLKDIEDLRDTEGIKFLDAMKHAGFPPEDYAVPIRNDIERFLEVHIEQGIVLEKKKKSIGIVTHIVGQRRYTIKIIGESNHAGTTPMNFRKDAITAAAQFVTHLTEKAKEINNHLVATVGRMNVKPNVPNVIAGEAEFTLDIRHHDERVLHSYSENIFSFLNQIAEQLGVHISVTQWMEVKPVEMDRKMNEWLCGIMNQKKIAYEEMVSGAGHDAQVFGTFCPTSLLFVPSKKGISHSPDEYTSVSDLEIGIEVLSEILYKLAY